MAEMGGIDLILAVATHAEEEAQDLVTQAAKLRARAAAMDVRVTTLRQMHSLAVTFQAGQKGEVGG